MATQGGRTNTVEVYVKGTPSPPMLFILAMDPLQKLLDKATEHGILAPIGVDPIKFRTRLYVDDAALFIRPTVQDLHNVQHILATFGAASGLHTNLQKSAMYLIQPQNLDTT